jgi:hypothetical protein
MKKLLVIAMVLLCSVGANAQLKNWEVKAGVGAAGVNGDNTSELKGKLMWKLGVGCEYGISESFSIQPSLMFVDKGYKIDGDGGKTINLGYIELPIMAAYRLGIGSGMNLVFNAGPYLGYGIAGTKVAGENDEEVSPFKNEFKRFEFGLGAGVKLEVEKFTVGIDYETGLTNMNQSVSEGSTPKNHNYTFGVNFGYKF